MSTAAKTERSGESSPLFKARMTGVFGLMTALTGTLALLVGGRLGAAANLRSTFLPRNVGALMVLAGLGWLTKSFASLLSPPLANYLSPYLMASGIIGEVALTLWLLVVGVNVQRWKEQASLAGR